MTDDSVIEARRALARYEDRNSKPNPAHLADAIRLLLARIDEAGAVFEKAHAPTDDEREALRVASPVTWGWDACVVCGSRDVTDRGMVVMASKADGAYVGRVAWCDGSQECRDDLRQAGASMLTEDQAEAVDAALRHSPTPTDDERKVLDRAVRGVTWNASNYPRRAQPHILGADIGPLTTKIVEAVESAGFRRSEVPEPQGEPSAAHVLEDFLGKLAGSGAYVLDFTSAVSLHGHIVRILKRDIAALRAAGVVGHEGESDEHPHK